MNISEVFVKRPVMTFLVFLTIIIFGCLAYKQLPVAELPSVDYPIIRVQTSYSGASPSTIAKTVTTPLEQQFMRISGLESMLSSSTDGNSEVILTFTVGTDISYILTQVQNAITAAKHDLPNLPSDPSVREVDPSARPIIDIVVASDTLKHRELYDLANQNIAEQLTMLQGVSDVSIRSVSSAVLIKLDPVKMAAYNVSLSDIGNSLNNENIDIATGSVDGEYYAYSLETDGQLTKPEEYNKLIVKYVDKNPIRIRDIGKAYESTDNENFRMKFFDSNGKELRDPVVIQVTRQTGSNTIAVANDVKKILNNLQETLPKSVHVSIFHDSSNTVLNSIDDVKLTLFFAFVFVVLIIFIFMGRIRDTVIPSIVMPVSVLSTFLIMYVLGFSLDNLSLMALTLAVGFIVDDAIVVLENNSRYIEMGMEPKAAAIKSAKEITGSIISMTLSLIVVFVPIVFMPGSVGMTFREFALTIIIVIVCSGIVSLTLTPMMNSLLLKKNSRKSNLLQRKKDTFILFLTERYGRLLNLVLKKYYLSVFIWLACIVGTIFFFISVPKTLLPNGDSGYIFGVLDMPLGTSSVQAAKFQDEVIKTVKKNKNVSRFFTITGLSSGADQSSGIVNIVLKPEKEREPIGRVVDELRSSLSNLSFPLGKVFLTEQPVLRIPTGGNHTATGAEYSYTIQGSERNDVYESAQKLITELKKNSAFQDIQSDVKLDLKQIKIEILRDKAGSFGITANDIANSLALAFAKGEVTDFTVGTNTYNVIIQNANSYTKNIADLSQINIRSSITGKLIPMISLIKFQESVGPQQISHYQGFVSATVSFNLKSGVSLGTATDEIQLIAKSVFAPGVQGIFLGTTQVFIAAMLSLGVLIIIAIFLKYVILGILYENLIHPITVLSALPIATLGGLGTLFFFNSELSLYAYIGMFLLVGLVAKNGIMIVDFALQGMRNEEKDVYDAVHSACLTRFRPIIMTGLTSIVGALPIAIGIGADAALRRPLGLVVVGGLLGSQLISLFVTPSIFLLFHAIGEKIAKKRNKS
jgi:hydrophobic/amphiphilic exporter-1 (mainly G- bacteria), HAE1 family